jgi:hypothetical protein
MSEGGSDQLLEKSTSNSTPETNKKLVAPVAAVAEALPKPPPAVEVAPTSALGKEIQPVAPGYTRFYRGEAQLFDAPVEDSPAAGARIGRLFTTERSRAEQAYAMNPVPAHLRGPHLPSVPEIKHKGYLYYVDIPTHEIPTTPQLFGDFENVMFEAGGIKGEISAAIPMKYASQRRLVPPAAVDASAPSLPATEPGAGKETTSQK